MMGQGKRTHEEYMTEIVDKIGLDRIIPHLPANRQEIERALIEDKYLNNIQGWIPRDVVGPEGFIGVHPVSKMMFQDANCPSHSVADVNSVLKTAANLWVERHKFRMVLLQIVAWHSKAKTYSQKEIEGMLEMARKMLTQPEHVLASIGTDKSELELKIKLLEEGDSYT